MSTLLARLRGILSGSGLAWAVAGRGAPRRVLLIDSRRAFQSGFERLADPGVLRLRELATALGERGYEVDVADHDETGRDLIRRTYDLVVDLHPVAQPIYAGRLAAGAIRIAWLTGANPRVANEAERRRLDDVARRRGARLHPLSQQPLLPHEALEPFDATFLTGNAATLASYAEFGLRNVHLLPPTGWDDLEPTPGERRKARRFLYLGTTGQVHEGLDLLLELFAALPQVELVVCGDFRRERDFTRAYDRELFETPNIRAVGSIDPRSAAFRELQAAFGALLLPSCAESRSGTVPIALAFGMPCAVSPESGFNDPELTRFPDCSRETLRSVVLELAARPAAEVARQAQEALALHHRRYRHERFARAVRAALDTTLVSRAPGAA